MVIYTGVGAKKKEAGASFLKKYIERLIKDITQSQLKSPRA